MWTCAQLKSINLPRLMNALDTFSRLLQYHHYKSSVIIFEIRWAEWEVCGQTLVQVSNAVRSVYPTKCSTTGVLGACFFNILFPEHVSVLMEDTLVTSPGHQPTGKGDIGSRPLLWRTVLCFSPAIQVLGFNTPQLYWWVWEIERRPFVHCTVYPRVVDRAPQWVITSSMTPSAAFNQHRWNSAYGNLWATALPAR